MPRPQHNTTHLPKKLREELGIRDTFNPDRGSGRGRGGRRSGPPQSRKEQRRAERDEKRALRRPGTKPDRVRGGRENGSEKAAKSARDGAQPKSIMKKRKVESEKDEDESGLSDAGFDDEDDVLDESDDDINEDEMDGLDEAFEDDAPSQPTISRTVQSKLDEDDAEIARLEKALGIKNKGKLPKSFKDDGLEDLLGDLAGESHAEGKKRKREEDDWLQSKRQKALAVQKGRAADIDLDESDATGSEDDMPASFDEDGDSEDEGSFAGFDDDEDEDATSPPPKKKPRENPYVAPIAATSTATAGKYVPPSLRAASPSESESFARLRRQTQGQLNKLSEANMISILSEIEKIYQSYPRQNVTTTLIDLLLALVYDRSSLNDTFINLHAGFIAAVYKVMGMDFGAQLVQRVVEQFDAEYERKRNSGEEESSKANKEMSNLVALLSHMYNLHVIGCGLVFDYIRLFLKEINELNTELLLKVIKSRSIFHNTMAVYFDI